MGKTNGSQLKGSCPASCVSPTTPTICQCSEGDTNGLHIDGIIPDINTSNSGSWAYQLFAICSPSKMTLIGFQFHEPVQITQFELFLFICYQWNIPGYQLNVIITASSFINIHPLNERILENLTVNMSHSNCSNLISFVIKLNDGSASTNYILMFSSQANLHRLFIGEIIFRNRSSVYSCKL